MAKITPSSLIAGIQGGFNGDTFQMLRGSIIRRKTVHQVWKPKYTHQRWQGLNSNISGKWAGLCAGQQTAWNCYAELLPYDMSGFNAFIARNVTNLYPDIPGLCYYETAPVTFDPPSTPSPFTAAYISGSGLFCFTWESPALTTVFSQIYGIPQPMYNNASNLRPKQVATVTSSDLCATYDASQYPSGTILHFRIRSINAFGESSAMSNTASATVG
jgi:hypothetical protein